MRLAALDSNPEDCDQSEATARTSKLLRVLEERDPPPSILINSETSSDRSGSDSEDSSDSSTKQGELRKGEKRKKKVKRLGSKQKRS